MKGPPTHSEWAGAFFQAKKKTHKHLTLDWIEWVQSAVIKHDNRDEHAKVAMRRELLSCLYICDVKHDSPGKKNLKDNLLHCNGKVGLFTHPLNFGVKEVCAKGTLDNMRDLELQTIFIVDIVFFIVYVESRT